MDRITHRPLTPDEIDRLRSFAPGRFKVLVGPAASGVFFFLLLSLPTLLIAVFWRESKPYLPLLFGIVFAWVLFQSIQFYRYERRHSRTISEDINRGEAEVRHYTAVDAIRVEESGDEGTGFFLRLTDGRILFLSAQLFYELEDQKRFPSDKFSYAVAPASQWFLGFECSGDFLPVSYSRPAFPLTKAEKKQKPASGDLYEGDFDALKSDEWPPAGGALTRIN